jgi:release factor glutamine methyltransferase
VIVSNPPYVPLSAYEHVDAEVRDFDPPLALWSGTDGLDMIRVVEATSRRLLRRVAGWAASTRTTKAMRAAGVRGRTRLAQRTGQPGPRRPLRFVTAQRS